MSCRRMPSSLRAPRTRTTAGSVQLPKISRSASSSAAGRKAPSRARCAAGRGADRVVTIARYGVFIESALRPGARVRLTESAREIRRWGVEWLRSIGAPDPELACELLLDQLDGLILHHLAYP